MTAATTETEPVAPAVGHAGFWRRALGLLTGHAIILPTDRETALNDARDVVKATSRGSTKGVLMSDTAYSGTTLYAGFWRRFIAIIIDTVVLDVGFGIVFTAAYAIFGSLVTDDGRVRPVYLLLYLLFAIASWLYFMVMESSPAQATLGKQALSIKVVDLGGTRVGFGRANGRFFAKLISYVIPLGVAFMMAGWTRQKQALHDMIASTLVIRSL